MTTGGAAVLFTKSANVGVDDMELVLFVVVALLGLAFAGATTYLILQKSDGNEKMREIASAIHEGAMAFLHREYKVLAIFIVVVFALLGALINWQTALAFLGGAVCSAAAGYAGMKVATKANVRTTEAARKGVDKALGIAFFLERQTQIAGDSAIGRQLCFPPDTGH